MKKIRIYPLALAAFYLLGATFARADDDTISPDRPSVANSAQVVGKGRFQLETGLQWERQGNDDLHARTLSTPTLLRFGIGETTELRIETEGRTVIHASEPGKGPLPTVAGYADTALGIKWHLAEQQGKGLGGMPSLAVLLNTALPSGSRELRGHGLRPSLSVPAEWELANGYSLGLMPGIGIDSDDEGKRYGYGVIAAELDKEFSERMHGFVELAAPQIARASHGGTQLLVDTGLAWLVNKDCQFDVFLAQGLNRRTPGLTLGFGLSVRR